MMKFLFAIPAILMLTLTACSITSTGTPIGSTSSGLPAATRLAVGTIRLAGSGQALTGKQAEDLVVYWETYKQLTQSDTAAQAEFDGLIVQIEETLTADQRQAITDMAITQQDMLTSMQGVAVSASSSAASSASSISTGNGGMPAGGPPAEGGGAPLDGGMPVDVSGAAPASSVDQTQSGQTSSSTSATAGVPSALIEAVIQSLQKIIAAG